MSADSHRIAARFYDRGEVAIGPGKAALLAAIDAAGSISGGARTMGLSYRRAWLLVDTMNRCWKQPLVASAAGGRRGGGATLTPLGHEILAAYLAMQADIEAVAAPHVARLGEHLASR